MSIGLEHDRELASNSIPLTESEALRILASGAIQEQGLLPYSSNYSFLITIDQSDVSDASSSHETNHGTASGLATEANQLVGVYKPQLGENPLWDFPWGTLCLREVAAFELSRQLNWHMVPPTVLREGPHGIGMVQLYIHNDEADHYFSITASARYEMDLRRLALFDSLINNADRKSGHCLVDVEHRLWAIDHGVAFHAEYKLRTVIWEFSGQRIADELLDDMQAVDAQLAQPESELSAHLRPLLTGEERAALQQRLRLLLDSRLYPQPDETRRNFPWPPI